MSGEACLASKRFFNKEKNDTGNPEERIFFQILLQFLSEGFSLLTEEGERLKPQQQKIKNLSLVSCCPELTAKCEQKRTVQL